jgi:lysophospholipase L1-like esterase
MKDRKGKRGHARVVPAAAPPADLPLRKKLLFSVVAALALLVALEAAARLFVHLAPNARWESHKQLVEAVGSPALNEILVPDPTLFWTLAPNVEGKVITGHIARSGSLSFTVSTDAHGARRVPAVANAQGRVAFIGDSTTFGFAVDDGQAFPAVVQERLGNVQCLNLGVPGYTAYQGHLQLQRFPFDAPPDVVVVDFGFNDAAAWDDLGDAEHEGRLWAQRSWLTRNLRVLSVLGRLFHRPEAASAGSGERRPRLTDDEFASEIRAIAAWCRERRAEPILLVWPVRGQLQRDELLPKQRVLLSLAESDGIKTVNLIPVFRAFGGPAAFADTVHASVAGNAIVADMLEPAVREALARRSR